MGFPEVTCRTQITNDMLFLLAYYQDTGHYPSRHSDLEARGGNPCCPSPILRTLVRKEKNLKQVIAGDLADGKKVGKFC
jgi:hypothetical protein